ncbi:hypothetical protein CF65_02199 [Aggregatibacter actinomycetemcomitans HK1651]|nr:hypothetical protein CF65_02199 [Aggregatibacter actinomycetemcomitans HK1651]
MRKPTALFNEYKMVHVSPACTFSFARIYLKTHRTFTSHRYALILLLPDIQTKSWHSCRKRRIDVG